MNDVKKKKTTENGRELIGKIVSMKMQKTVIVAVDHVFQHPLYRKSMRRTRRFHVHNEMTDLKMGDFVKISETKPISKNIHFIIKEKIVLNK